VTTNKTSNSAPNGLFAPNASESGFADVSVLTNITSSNSQLRFKLNYNTEETWDGTALEIKIGNGEYKDVLAAGGSFVSGGYNTTINPEAAHVLSGRPAWSGNSNGYIDTIVNLPSTANGQIVNLRFRTASDSNTAEVGTFIDNVEIIGGKFFSSYDCSKVAADAARADYDGDGKTDRLVFRSGVWYVLRSREGFIGQAWGAATDQIVSGDFDGDNKDDYAVYREGPTSYWHILNSGNSSITSIPFGTVGDVPITGDFNGDGKDDIGVFRNGNWYIAPSGGGVLIVYAFGQAGDKPLIADFDGDNKSDIAVIRNGNWYILGSTNGFSGVAFGQAEDVAVPADYDGDNKDDIAVFRKGNWYILRSSDGRFQTVFFGQAGDEPVPGDYDGDGRDDQAVYRDGNWYILGSTNGFNAALFGVDSDLPVASVFTMVMQ
jgi:hypothetical protein